MRAAGVPTIGGTRQGLGAVDRLARWSMPGFDPLPEPPPTARIAAYLRNGKRRRAAINEVDAKKLLGEAGLPVVPERVVASREDALAAARDLGYPVVLKVASDDVPHKSDLGLVAAGLTDETVLAAAFDEMGIRLEQGSPPPADAVFVVQTMVRDAVELFMGVSRDPDFGLVLAYGLGGVLAEILDDVALRPLPLHDGDVNEMIGETRGRRLLGAVRGRPARDVQALRLCLTGLAEFAWAERDSVAEIDLNPVMALPRGQGCVVVDALIIPREDNT